MSPLAKQYAAMNSGHIVGVNKMIATTKLYDLIWNGQTLVSAQPYAVCLAVKNARKATHNLLLFDIVKHKP